MVFFLHLLVIRYWKSVGVVIKCCLLILWPSSRTTVLVSFHNRHTLNQRYTQMKALSPKLKIKCKSLVAFGNQECFIMHNSFCCVEAVSWDKLLKQMRSKRKTNAEIKGYQLFTYIVIYLLFYFFIFQTKNNNKVVDLNVKKCNWSKHSHLQSELYEEIQGFNLGMHRFENVARYR